MDINLLYSVDDWVVHTKYGVGQIKTIEVKPIALVDPNSDLSLSIGANGLKIDMQRIWSIVETYKC